MNQIYYYEPILYDYCLMVVVLLEIFPVVECYIIFSIAVREQI